MTEQLDVLDVTLEIVIPQELDESRREMLTSSVEQLLLPTMERMKEGHEVAEALNLPTSVPINLAVKIVQDGAHNGGHSEKDEHPLALRALVHGGPSLAKERFDAVADRVGDALYHELRTVEVPEDVLQILGRSKGQATRFELQFTEEPVEVTTLEDLTIVDQDWQPHMQSWEKGCSSWPW